MNPLIGAGLISGAGSFLGGLFGASAQDKANETNIALARENRAWQTNMAHSAHEYEVRDLRNAGLNPVLSANAGATTPSGGAPSVESVNPMSGVGDLGGVVSGALQAQNLAKESTLKDAQAVATLASAESSKAHALNLKADTARTVADMPSVKARASSAQSEADLARVRSDINKDWAKFDAWSSRILNGLGGLGDIVNIRRMLEHTKSPRQREHEWLEQQGTSGSRTRLP